MADAPKLLDRVRNEVRMRHYSRSNRKGVRALDPSIRTQELLGHSDVSTTMIYTHVLNRGGLGVRTPIDRM